MSPSDVYMFTVLEGSRNDPGSQSEEIFNRREEVLARHYRQNFGTGLMLITGHGKYISEFIYK